MSLDFADECKLYEQMDTKYLNGDQEKELDGCIIKSIVFGPLNPIIEIHIERPVEEPEIHPLLDLA